MKLEIINSNLKINSGVPKYHPIDSEQFKLHIKELLELKLIRKSNSPHRSAAMIVIKESEKRRGKKSFIGLVNQARDFIPNLGKIIGPLYSKTNPKGEKKFNLQDKILIEKI